MEFNWKWVIYLTILGFLLFCAVFVISSSAITNDNDNDNDNSNLVKAPMSTSNRSIEVYQGDTVYWGDTVDLTLIGGWYGILQHDVTGKRVDISAFTHKILIDKNVFTVGRWNQWSEYKESGANNVAFYVSSAKRPPIKTGPNETALNQTNVTTIKPYIQPVPIKHVADILVARGDPLLVDFRNAKIWIFGRSVGYYDYKIVNETIAISKSEIQKFEVGTYILVSEEFTNGTPPGYFFRYDAVNERFEYFDPEQFKVIYVDMFGIEPRVRLSKFRELQKYTPNVFTEYTLIIDDPKVEITDLDQQYVNDTVFTQTVRGYTNVAKGRTLTITIDADPSGRVRNRYSQFTTTVQGSDDPGAMRWYEKTIPLLWENFAAGPHTITVSSPIGGSMSVGYTVYETPEHSFIPNNTIKYVNGSEWRPDPTPKIIERVVTQKVIEVVTKEIPVPPPQASVDEAQQKALNNLVTMVALIVSGTVITIGTVWYFRSVYIRTKFERTYFKGGLK